MTPRKTLTYTLLAAIVFAASAYAFWHTAQSARDGYLHAFDGARCEQHLCADTQERNRYMATYVRTEQYSNVMAITSGLLATLVLVGGSASVVWSGRPRHTKLSAEL